MGSLLEHPGPNGPHAPLPEALTPHFDSVILVGGTFDPPHLAHTKLAIEARAAAGLERAFLLYVPASHNPLKSCGPVAGDEERLAMVHLALRDVPNAGVWSDEIDRCPNQAAYTIDTVRRLRGALPGTTKLRLLIGADQALLFQKWREAAELLTLSPPIVMLRGSDCTALLTSIEETKAWSPEQHKAWKQAIVSTSQMNISSTRIRALLARKRDAGEERELVSSLHPDVLAYIFKHALYRS